LSATSAVGRSAGRYFSVAPRKAANSKTSSSDKFAFRPTFIFPFQGKGIELVDIAQATYSLHYPRGKESQLLRTKVGYIVGCGKFWNIEVNAREREKPD
jgi:hypothetical protein